MVRRNGRALFLGAGQRATGIRRALGTSGLEQSPHRRVTARVRQRSRCAPVAVGQLRIRSGLQKVVNHTLVARATVAQDNGLNQRRPVQIVDMIERRTRLDQLADNAVVAQVGGGDQSSALVAAAMVGYGG